MSPFALLKPQERNVFAMRAQRYAIQGKSQRHEQNFVLVHKVSPKNREAHVMTTTVLATDNQRDESWPGV